MNLSPLNTVMSRKLAAFSEISCVNFSSWCSEFASSKSRKARLLSDFMMIKSSSLRNACEIRFYLCLLSLNSLTVLRNIKVDCYSLMLRVDQYVLKWEPLTVTSVVGLSPALAGSSLTVQKKVFQAEVDCRGSGWFPLSGVLMTVA